MNSALFGSGSEQECDERQRNIATILFDFRGVIEQPIVEGEKPTAMGTPRGRRKRRATERMRNIDAIPHKSGTNRAAGTVSNGNRTMSRSMMRNSGAAS